MTGSRIAVPQGAALAGSARGDYAEGAALARKVVLLQRGDSLRTIASVAARQPASEADRQWQDGFLTTARRLAAELREDS